MEGLSDFLVDEAGRRLTIDVDEPLRPANQRLMDFLGVEVRVTATVGGVSCLVGGCEWRFDGDFKSRLAAIEKHREEEHDYIPAHRFSVRSDAGRDALDAMDSLLTQRELLGVDDRADDDEPPTYPGQFDASDSSTTDEVPKPEEEVETVTSTAPAWTRETILEAFQTHHRDHGRLPTKREWTVAGNGHPSAYVIDREFGTWADAVQAAGFPKPTRGGNTRSSVREPKAREAASAPPPADVKQPAPTGDDAVVRESPGTAVGTEEAGSRTDEYTEWLASKVDVALLTGEMDELERLAAECQRKADALRQIVAAVRKLEALDGVVDE